MKHLKTILAVILALCVSLCLCACGSETQPTEAPTELPTEAPSEAATEAPAEESGYSVTVVDEAGNPIAGALVQLCVDTCYPGVTDANGVAKFAVEEADYKVSFLSLPAGYTYSSDVQEFYFEDGSMSLTITLKAEA